MLYLISSIKSKSMSLLMMLFVFAMFGYNANARVIFTQYVETNSGTAPKGVEIMNVSGANINLAAENILVRQYANGATTPNQTATINSGTFRDGEVIVIGTADMGTYLINNGLESVRFINLNFQFNGDDALDITVGGVRVDMFGQVGVRPSNAWPSGVGNHTQGVVKTLNSNIERIDGMLTPTPNGWADPAALYRIVDEPAGSSPLVNLVGFGEAPKGYKDPVKLMISEVAPSKPFPNLDFKITVSAVDNNNMPQPVSRNTSISINKIAGMGNISGNMMLNIPNGESSVSFTLRYDRLGSLIIKAMDNSPANPLTETGEQFISFIEGPARLVLNEVYPKGHVAATHPSFTVTAYDADGREFHYINGGAISVSNNGDQSELVNYEATFVNGVATFNNLQFTNTGNFEVVANAMGMMSENTRQVNVRNNPMLQDVAVPLYMSGVRRRDGANNFGERIPAFALVEVQNLHPNTQYRYISSGTDVMYADNDPILQSPTIFNRGNMIYSDGYREWYNGSFGDLGWSFSANNCVQRYSTFVTGPNETSKRIWVNLIPVNVDMYDPTRSNGVYWMLSLAFEDGSFVRRMQTQSSTTPLVFNIMSNPNYLPEHSATGIYDNASELESGTYVGIYSDNNVVRPLSFAKVEADGWALQTPIYNTQSADPCDYSSYFAPEGAPFYTNITGGYNADGVMEIPEVEGGWATLMPNRLQGGANVSVTMLENYDKYGNRIQYRYSGNGSWYGVSTMNPTGSIDNPIRLRHPELRFTSHKGIADYCNTGTIELTWESYGLQNVTIYMNNVTTGEQTIIYNNQPAMTEEDGSGKFTYFLERGSLAGNTLSFWIVAQNIAGLEDRINDFINYDKPVISTVSESAVICEGETIEFAVSAEGSNVQYQWRKDARPIEGATSSNLRIQNARHLQSGVYTCNITGADVCGITRSPEITLYVARNTQITRQPENAGVAVGGMAVISFDAHVNGAAPDYKPAVQWYVGTGANAVELKDNENYAGTKSNLLTIRNVSANMLANPPQLWAKVEGLCGDAAETNVVTLLEFGFDIVEQPDVNRVACLDEMVSLHFIIESKNPNSIIRHQWFKDGVALVGEINSRLDVENITKADAGDYYCEATIMPEGLKVTSEMGNIIVYGTPVVTRQPVDISVEEGKDLVLTLEAEDATSYQWIVNGLELPEFPFPTLEIIGVDRMTHTGEWVCLVKNPCDSVFSVAINVTITTGQFASVETSSIVNGFSINNIFPNPASQTSTLTFETEKVANVEFDIITESGAVVGAIPSAQFTPGLHNIELNVSDYNLSSGVYFIILKADDGTRLNAKFVVIR